MYPRLAIRRTLAETHKSLAGLAGDRSTYASWTLHGGGRRLHAISARGRSELAVVHLERAVLPEVFRRPAEWLFLIEPEPPGSDRHDRDQYTLAAMVARHLHVALPEHPFVASIDEEVIAAAVEQGLPPSVRPDDLYGALCYDLLPKQRTSEAPAKSLEAAAIHAAINPRLEAIRLIHQFAWNLEIDRLTDIITEVLRRTENDSVGMLEEFYDLEVRQLLREQRTRLNRRLLKQLLREHGSRSEILLMGDEQHFPLVIRSHSSLRVL